MDTFLQEFTATRHDQNRLEAAKNELNNQKMAAKTPRQALTARTLGGGSFLPSNTPSRLQQRTPYGKKTAPIFVYQDEPEEEKKEVESVREEKKKEEDIVTRAVTPLVEAEPELAEEDESDDAASVCTLPVTVGGYPSEWESSDDEDDFPEFVQRTYGDFSNFDACKMGWGLAEKNAIDNFEEIWESLHVPAHDSDTEIDGIGGKYDEEYDEPDYDNFWHGYPTVVLTEDKENKGSVRSHNGGGDM